MLKFNKIIQIIILQIILFISLSFGDEYSQSYEAGEEVILFTNKIGPFRNPSEMYSFSILAYCHPETAVESRFEGLGEAIQGYELQSSAMRFHFKRSIDKKTICKQKLSDEQVDMFKHAVRNQWWYQMFLDDLPIWGMVGESIPEPSGGEKLYIFTHSTFFVTFNQDRIIEVNLTTENPVLLKKQMDVEFTYSVTWIQTDETFEDRFEKYLDFDFFEHQIHWFSIFNSFMMVIFLVGLVSMILLRTLRKDYAKYARDDEDVEDADVGSESGWKKVHGDVFRSPSSLPLFAAAVGTGHQLILTVFALVFLAAVGDFYAYRGSMTSWVVVLYVLLSFFGGFSGGSLHCKISGGTRSSVSSGWQRVVIFLATLLPATIIAVFACLQIIAFGYGSLAVVPWTTVVVLLSFWIFGVVPLTVIGVVVGRHWNGTPDHPCRIAPAPGPLPQKPWYLNFSVLIPLGGMLPFGSIFIEMYFILTSFWHYKYYYVYGFMLLVFCILLIVNVCVSIVSTYFLLNAEDYRWHWSSFLSSASTAVYVFCYSVYYFFFKTRMNGFFQTTFYFGYTFVFCVALALLCGAAGYTGTSAFVRKIYQNVKVD